MASFVKLILSIVGPTLFTILFISVFVGCDTRAYKYKQQQKRAQECVNYLAQKVRTDLRFRDVKLARDTKEGGVIIAGWVYGYEDLSALTNVVSGMPFKERIKWTVEIYRTNSTN